MSFPKTYHITERDETVSHAVARTLHSEQSIITRQRKVRKLPKNMDPMKKAAAMAGSDLILSAGSSKKAFMIAYFGASHSSTGDVGFGLGVDTAIIDGHDRHSQHSSIAAVSAHAAARIIGRTVHTADRSALREAIRPAFLALARLWVDDNKQFCALAGHELAVITSRGALLGQMRPGREVQAHFATWVDAHGAFGREIPDMCHAIDLNGGSAIIAIKQDWRWNPI